jgi:hypothetical protein
MAHNMNIYTILCAKRNKLLDFHVCAFILTFGNHAFLFCRFVQTLPAQIQNRGMFWQISPMVPGTIGVHLVGRVMQESAKNAKKSENAGEKLVFSTLDLTGKSLSKRLWCLAPSLVGG